MFPKPQLQRHILTLDLTEMYYKSSVNLMHWVSVRWQVRSYTLKQFNALHILQCSKELKYNNQPALLFPRPATSPADPKYGTRHCTLTPCPVTTTSSPLLQGMLFTKTTGKTLFVLSPETPRPSVTSDLSSSAQRPPPADTQTPLSPSQPAGAGIMPDTAER